MVLDGLAIEISYDDARVDDLLEFLLTDLRPEYPGANKAITRYEIRQTLSGWALSLQGKGPEVEYANLVDLIIPLFDRSMTRLAQENQNSISLHAALVSDASGSIILPGMPGSGKTSACLWLSHLGMHYHSDEMVTIDRETLNLSALTRPYTLKNPVIQALNESLDLSFEVGKHQGRIVESSLKSEC